MKPSAQSTSSATSSAVAAHHARLAAKRNGASDAASLCVKDVVYVHKSLALNEAARKMREHHVGSLVVVEDQPFGRTVVGMLTDRDIVLAVVARDLDASALRVEDVMTANVVSARAEDSLADVLATMRRRGVRRLPVTGPRGELLGVLAADDVLSSLSEDLRSLVQAISSQPKLEQRARP